MRQFIGAILILAIPAANAAGADSSQQADGNQVLASQQAFESINPNYYAVVPFDLNADSSVRFYSQLFRAVRTDSVLATTYRSLGVRSDRGAPRLTRTRAGGKSLASLRSEGSYQVHSEADIRRIVAQAYRSASCENREKLVALFVAADRRFVELSESMQRARVDDTQLLRYAYERAVLAQRVFKFDVKARVADTARLAQLLETFDWSSGIAAMGFTA